MKSLRIFPVLLRLAASAVAAAVAAYSQEPPAPIALESPHNVVEASFNSAGTAEVGLEGTTPYGLRLDSNGEGVQSSLLCTADPVLLKEQVWNRVTGACRVLISSAGDAAFTRRVRLSISSDPYPARGDSSPADLPARGIEIRIAPFRTGSTSTRYIWPIAAGGLLLAGTGLLLYRRKRSAAAAELDEFEESEAPQAGAESVPPLPRARKPEHAAPQAAPIAGSAWEGVLQRIGRLEEQVGNVQQTEPKQIDEALGRAVSDLGRSAAMLRDEAQHLHSSAAENLLEMKRWAASLESLLAIPPERLSALLSAAPETALALRGSPESMAALAERFDAAVRECVRDTAGVRSELEPMAKTLASILPPLASLYEVAAKAQNRRLAERLAEVQAEVENLSREVAAALGGTADRVSLYFRLDLPAPLGQTLAGELAGCLRKQLVRLADPVAYFGMRFEMTIGQALQEVIDCCDSLLDPARRVDGVQKQLGALVRETDAALIEPKPGSPLLDTEHTVFGVVRGSNPADRPDHIQTLRVRGLKRRGQVLRKASVVIFG